MQRCLLLNPPTGMYLRDDRCQGPVNTAVLEPPRAPMDLAYMAAMLRRAGVECRIRDLPAEGAGWPALMDELRAWQPSHVVISTTAPTLRMDLRAAAMAKEVRPETVVIVKGPHLAVLSGDSALWAPVDVGLYLEPEFTVAPVVTGSEPLAGLPGILYREGGRLVMTGRPRQPHSLSELPLPARDLLNNDLYRSPDTGERLGVVLASLGCPYRCSFCLAPFLTNGRVLFRDPASVVDELEICVRQYQMRDFFFRADTFTIHRDWVVELCRLIRQRGLRIRWGANSRLDTVDRELLHEMAAAGAWIIAFGIESGSQETLDRVHKRLQLHQARQVMRWCREAGVLSHCMYMLGFPWEDRAGAEQTIATAMAVDSDFAEFNIVFPMPGTELYQTLVEQGAIKPEQVFEHDYHLPVAGTAGLAPADLQALRSRAITRFYLRLPYIWRTLRRIKSWGEFRRYAVSALRLAEHPWRWVLRPLGAAAGRIR